MRSSGASLYGRVFTDVCRRQRGWLGPVCPIAVYRDNTIGLPGCQLAGTAESYLGRGEETMRELDYAVVDVFAERVFEGNPLAVFADGRDLTGEQMQTIAREMKLSETVFVLPRAAVVERERGVLVRIFTTEEELAFAGHPTLGAASWLHWHHSTLRNTRTIVLEMHAGRIPVECAVPEPGRPGIFATMRQNDPEFLPVHGAGWPTRAEMAEALGLAAEEIGLADPNPNPDADAAPVQVVSTGTAFCLVPVRSVAALERLDTSRNRVRALAERLGTSSLYCFARAQAGSGADWRARIQFSDFEDPATGSAAGCLIAWLVRYGLAASGRETILAQGIEMLRPSRLTLRASHTIAGITDVFVGGRTIPVAQGRLSLP